LLSRGKFVQVALLTLEGGEAVDVDEDQVVGMLVMEFLSKTAK
jgi:hypothetical protein